MCECIIEVDGIPTHIRTDPGKAPEVDVVGAPCTKQRKIQGGSVDQARGVISGSCGSVGVMDLPVVITTNPELQAAAILGEGAGTVAR